MFEKWLYRTLILLFLLQVSVPFVGLIQFTLEGGTGAVSLSGFAALFSDPSFLTSLLNSMWLAIAAVVLAIAVFTPPVWHAHLYAPKLLRVIEALSFTPFVVPAVVLALAYVQFFSSGPLDLVGTPDLLPFAFALIGMPFYVQVLLNRLRHVDARSVHEAAQTLGANDFQAFVRIQLPALRPGIINGSLLVFTIAIGEFTVTQLTTGGSYSTLPLYLMITFTNNPLEGSAMAILTLLLALVGVVSALFAASGRHRRVRSRISPEEAPAIHAIRSQLD